MMTIKMKGKRSIRRALSVLLACAMLLTSVEVTAFAAEPNVDATEVTADTEEDTDTAAGDIADGQQGTVDGTGEPDSPETDAEEQGPDAADENDQPEAEEGENQPDAPDTEEEDTQPENPEEDLTGEDESDSDIDEQPAEKESEQADVREVSVVTDEQTTNDSNLQVTFRTQDEIRNYLAQSNLSVLEPITYEIEPVTSAPYTAGVLSDRTQQTAIDMLNQIRYIAGLSYDVVLDESYASMAQAASLLNYTNEQLSHRPEQPADMEDELYQLGYNGAGKSNIAYASQYANSSLNNTLLISWMADDDDGNIPMVGHRRWILNPSMGKTGFGAVSGTKGTYSAVYAHDTSGSGGDVFGVAWPAQNMPISYFQGGYPWSVSLAEYVTASEIKVTLTRISDGKVWNFSSESTDGYFTVNNDLYGEIGCIIFRPSNIGSYKDGDTYRVEITKNGEDYVNYSVNFFDAASESGNPENPEDPDESGEMSLSGVTVEDKIYDGEAMTYTGTPIFKDASGNTVDDVSVETSYTGKLMDGSIYEKSADAPAQAGDYTLLFELTGTDADKYKLKDASYNFRINPKEIIITAESVETSIGGQVPETSGLQYTVAGMLEGDALVTEPLMKYSEDNISTNETGTYEIIPYAADAGNNYSIKYVNGTLTVGDGDVSAGEEIVDSGKINDISWKINKNGKLTIEGTGDYTDGEGKTLPPWIEAMVWEWENLDTYPYPLRQFKITSAEVKVTNMTCAASMFKNCKNLKSVDLSGFDMSTVTDVSGMFYGCRSLESLDLSNFSTGSVTNMGGMFYDCRSLESLDLSNFNTGSVTNMRHMFYDCSSLESLDLGNFNTGSVTDMAGMFSDCSSLRSLNVSNFNTGKVTDMEEMFLNCSSLESLDLKGFVFRGGYGGTWDGLQYKFLGGCGSLKTIRTPEKAPGERICLPTPDDGSQWYDENGGRYKTLPHAVTGGNTSIVLTAKKLNSGVDHNISWEIDENGKLTISGSGDYNDGYNTFLMIEPAEGPDTPPWVNRSDVITAEVNVNGITSTANMFLGCRNLRNVDLSGLDTRAVKRMDYMFSGCGSLQSIDLSNFDTGSVSSMTGMFSECSSLQSIDLGNFDTGSVSGMANMFSGCSSLQSLNLSNFDTGNVGSMKEMFSGCSSLLSLDLRSFNTEKVSDMKYMFFDCSGLQYLNLSSFDTGKVTNMFGMFQNCSSLQNLNLSTFDMSKATAGNLLEGCGNLSYIRTPVMSTGDVWLPGDGVWHDNTMKEYTMLPRELSESIALYKDKEPAEGTAKQYVSVTGLSIVNKTYDGKSNPYTGMAVVTDAHGNLVPDVTLTAVYSGTLADGSIYENTTEAPSQAGSYTLTFALDDDHAEQYILKESTYMFGINRKKVTITASDRAMEIGGQLPDLSRADDYVVEGLVEGELLLKNPSLRYGETDISTDRPGNHDIIPYGAEAGSNYLIKYVGGTLAIGTSGSMDLSEAEIIFDDITYTYEGNTYKNYYHPVEPVVRYRDWTLKKGTDYTLSLSGPGYTSYGGVPACYAVGDYVIKITGIGYYVGQKEKKFRLAKKSSDEPVIHPEFGEVRPEDVPADGRIPEGLWIAGLSEEGYYYTGQAIRPEVRVYDHKTLLKEKTDYVISYKRNVNVNQIPATGTADDNAAGNVLPTITVTGKGNYSSKAEKYFNILPVDFSEEGNVETVEMTVAYANRAQKPDPSLIWNGKKLKKNKDYTIAYHDYAGENYNERLDSVKETGDYGIELIGRGNFTGSYWCNLTVTDSLKLISKVKVGKIPNQRYHDGGWIEPDITVKDGKTKLERDVHYSVEYLNNMEVGTASVIIRGIEAKGYSGTKRVNFKITGTPISKAKVEGLQYAECIYSGVDMKPDLQLTVPDNSEGTQGTKYLQPGTDYTITWQKNRNAGTATVVFTGMGGYTGTLKKTFRIKKFNMGDDWEEKISVDLAQSEVPYAKGGAKPKLTVTFWNEDGSIQTLKEGRDYTLSYKRNMIVTKGEEEPSSVTIKGKGNFSGTYGTEVTYVVTPQDIANLKLTAQDKAYQNRKNIYATKVIITDLDGKVLKAGKDYDKVFTYTYKNETMVNGGTEVRVAGSSVDQNDIIPEGTVLQVQVKAKEGSNYFGTITGEYRITKASIASASVSVEKQIYTGKAVTLDKSQITVRVKGEPVAESDYEIVEDSYKNNDKKGTASVTLRGINNYGGTKTVKFTIKAKNFSWGK